MRPIWRFCCCTHSNIIRTLYSRHSFYILALKVDTLRGRAMPQGADPLSFRIHGRSLFAPSARNDSRPASVGCQILVLEEYKTPKDFLRQTIFHSNTFNSVRDLIPMTSNTYSSPRLTAVPGAPILHDPNRVFISLPRRSNGKQVRLRYISAISPRSEKGVHFRTIMYVFHSLSGLAN